MSESLKGKHVGSFIRNEWCKEEIDKLNQNMTYTRYDMRQLL